MTVQLQRLKNSPVIPVSGVILLAACLYLPGLGGRFLLDDYYNLHDLDQVRQYGQGAYVFGSGFAGPTGRPVSLLTFAMQHASWPDNPAAFKLFNIILHLFNTVLVYCLCRQLARLLLKRPGRPDVFSTVVAAFWSLHPVQISTTLYVVQRMTQLSALFTLLGMIGYLHFRLRPDRGNDGRRLVYMGLIVATCTGLATLSKENGVLLPLYLLVIEGTLLASQPRDRRLVIWKAVFLVLPLLFLAVYLGANIGDVYRSYLGQGYSMYQKTITENVVLLEYVKNIFFPRPSAFSLYHDDYPASAGLLDPPVTLLSLAMVSILAAFALVKRRSQPVFGFACLWFLGGHILESGYLNLELYFEHRNYLPSLGLFFGMAWLGTRAVNVVSRKAVIYAAVAGYCLLVLAITGLEIDIWAKPGVQAVEWARRHPRSERAQQDLLQFYLINDDYRNAQTVVSRLEEIVPEYFYPSLYRIYIDACRLRRPVSDAGWTAYTHQAGRAGYDGLRTTVVLDRLVLYVLQGSCPALPADRLGSLIQNLADNRDFSGNAVLPEYQATLALYSGRYAEALEFIRRSIQLGFTVPRKLLEVRLLVQLGDTAAARVARAELQEYLQNNYRMQLAYGRMTETLKIE